MADREQYTEKYKVYHFTPGVGVISDTNSQRILKREQLTLLTRVFMQRIQLISTNFWLGS